MSCGPPPLPEFFAERIEADAMHEQLARHSVIAPPLAAEPALASDVMFGIQASTPLTDRLFDVPTQHPPTVTWMLCTW